MGKVKILFHSNGEGKHCPDGFGAAYCAWRYFGGQCEFVPCVYQQPAPEIEAGDEVYLLDFSYPRDVLLVWKEIAGSITVLDHHKTAQADLEGLSFAQFDMNRSGAQMAWNSFFPHYPKHHTLIDYIADRDLWRKALPFTEEVHLALSSFPQDFEVWDTLARLPNYVNFMRRIGAPLLEKRTSEIAELADWATWGNIGEHRALCTHTNRYGLVSDALNLVCKAHPETPFAFNFWESEEGVKYELRSIGDFDVSAIAKQFGGGGHKNAAGCFIPKSA